MVIKRMNKKGDERVLSIYLFIIFIIVSIGIVSGVLLFHGAGLDVREVEADILADKVIDCLVEQGELKNQVFADNFTIGEFCNINLRDNSITYKGEEQSAISVELFDFNSCSKDDKDEVGCSLEIRDRIIIGRNDFELCNEEGDKIPKCSEKYVYVLNNEKGVMLRVLGVVRKIEKNV